MSEADKTTATKGTYEASITERVEKEGESVNIALSITADAKETVERVSQHHRRQRL